MIHFVLYILSVFCFFVNGNETITTYRHLPRDCGRTRFATPRIIDGNVADLGQFPWMARIGIRRNQKTIFHCGGSLINRYYVVTAANCKDRLVNIVRLGENYLTGDRDCSKDVCAPPHQDILIKNFTSHENYCPVTYVNDFALIQLAGAVTFNDFVQPICFPRQPLVCDDLLKEPAFISGWGLLDWKSKEFPYYLMYMLAPALDRDVCNVLYSTKLEDSQLCMGYMKGRDACDFDSGGPVAKLMQTDTGEHRFVLRGLVSYGLQICGKGPAVYTDVSHFAEWAMDIIYKS